ncbi:hypothetical protein BD311DRAFT_657634, partial [Dichomitus squalens]
HIPVEVLLREKEVQALSVAQRMSWAFGRRTTRVEDRAYSLLGMFSINMYPVYGEGERAFQRLQEEIMKQSIDPSLFAWGAPVEPDYPAPERWKSLDNHNSKHIHPQSYLLTPTPDSSSPGFSGSMIFNQNISEVTHAGETRCCPIADPESDPNIRSIPTFTITPYGCLARIACFRTGDCLLANLGCQWWNGVLSTDDSWPVPVWLPLTPCPDAQDKSRPLYHTDFFHPRVVAFHLHKNQLEAHKLEWQEIYIALWHTTPKPTSPSIPIDAEYHSDARFRFPWEAIQKAFPGWIAK